MRKYLLCTLFGLFLATGSIASVGCKEGPLEEAAEEIEDEIDDATTN